MQRMRDVTRRTSVNIIDKSNLTEVIKQTRWIFSSLGLWPMMTKHTTTIERRLSMPVHILCQSLLIVVICPALFHLLFIEKNFKMKIALFAPVGVAIGCVFKCMAIIHRRRVIKMCIERMIKDWAHVRNEEDYRIMRSNLEFGKKVTTLCATFMYSGGVSHQIVAPFLPGSIISIVDNSSRRMLVYPVYDSIFNTEVTPVYEIMYLTHILTGIITCTISISVCHLSIFFITHVTGQVQIMILKLENLTNNQDTGMKHNLNERMGQIIDHYNKIIIFSSDVEKCLREICLIAIIEALFIICTVQYYSMLAWKNDETFGAIIYFILVDAFIFNCFIFCYVGELSKEQFKKVGEAIYMTEWYRLSRENARALILIIAVTQHPPKITAGGLMELSYNGFIFVIKTTAAYFNILRMVDF